MKRSTTFFNARTQTVRLPNAVNRVDIIALGNARIITPADSTWGPWFDGPRVTSDFMLERGQPKGDN